MQERTTLESCADCDYDCDLLPITVQSLACKICMLSLRHTGKSESGEGECVTILQNLASDVGSLPLYSNGVLS